MTPGVQRVMIDGTERPIARPQDSERQKHKRTWFSDFFNNWSLD
ncbi:MAG: hypothetical protein RM368_32075 [Nostoc sp. DedSLP03]|nr:hypothetical protein [Nostoc sp. DedSLP03]